MTLFMVLLQNVIEPGGEKKAALRATRGARLRSICGNRSGWRPPPVTPSAERTCAFGDPRAVSDEAAAGPKDAAFAYNESGAPRRTYPRLAAKGSADELIMPAPKGKPEGPLA